jgi:hypothetical protein
MAIQDLRLEEDVRMNSPCLHGEMWCFWSVIMFAIAVQSMFILLFEPYTWMWLCLVNIIWVAHDHSVHTVLTVSVRLIVMFNCDVHAPVFSQPHTLALTSFSHPIPPQCLKRGVLIGLIMIGLVYRECKWRWTCSVLFSLPSSWQ